ncbi:uracil-DNA glycosylase [Nitrosococcus wardiae]|uniref:Type-4 uracil-DNA glycosylase n=1 Tax=Nitrosococcus wardiae TaxID=1814290 RepID=A0A4P7BTL2_9GAMM|nr:uracil-DNA glycosylase [Nitrosococcus wardiae]QBQ53233.1 uracil-DNA glycosylase [Nitrosococcus wardiae]
MDSRHRRYLEVMGIQLWRQRQPANAERAPTMEVGGMPGESMPAEIAPGWEELAARVAGCTACSLHCSRTQTVFGVGDREAKWLIVGEAPGADEDRQGEPFVGRAGQLLNAMLEALGLQRGQVYIANILKCRPPKNRDPLPEEVASCEPYLRHQMALLQPRIILAVGRVAGQNLLKTSAPLGRLRGIVHQYPDTTIPLVVTYHPAYLLRSPREKRRAWQDLRLALKVYREL